MRRQPPKNLPSSVRERLAYVATSRRYDFQQVLTTYAIERLLFRLSSSRFSQKFVVKWATLFTLWEGFPHRQTRDLDLLGLQKMTASRLVSVFQKVCAFPVVPDGINFKGRITSEPIRAFEDVAGTRLHLVASLEKAVVSVAVDVGFGDQITPKAVEVEFPTLLDFPAPRLLVYPVETVVAEKVEAMVRLGMANSRMKDFFDLWHLSKLTRFEGDRLTAALCATFARRGSLIPEGLPVALTDEFGENPSKITQWRAFCRKDARLQTTTLLSEVLRDVAVFLEPLIRSANSGKKFHATWHSGRWHER